jgi:hypothetical protein
MAEDRALARGQQSGNEESVLCGELGRLRREHAPVDGMQPAGAQRAVDHPSIDTGPQQLRAGDDALLISRDSANHLEFASFSGANPRWFDHQLMVDPPPPTEQDGFVSSPLIARPDTSAKRTADRAAKGRLTVQPVRPMQIVDRVHRRPLRAVGDLPAAGLAVAGDRGRARCLDL